MFYISMGKSKFLILFLIISILLIFQYSVDENNSESVTINSDDNQINYDPLNSPLVAGIIAALITIIPTWIIATHTHKKNIDKEALSTHFNELKENVISKLIYILKNSPDDTPSLKEVKKDEITTKVYFKLSHIDENTIYYPEPITFDGNLTRDLIANHYPKLKQYWSEFYNCLETKKNNRQKLSNELEKKLDNLHVAKQNSNLKIDIIITCLLEMYDIKGRNFNFYNKIWPNNKHAIHFKSDSKDYGSINDEILQVDTEKECKQIIIDLNKSIDEILQNNENVKAYENSILQYEESHRTFYRILSILMHKTNLRNEKHRFKPKCEFVKSQI